VDGLLKPNGPTIGKIAETAHGFWEGPNNDHRDVLELPSSSHPPKPPMDTPDLPGGEIWEKPQPIAGGPDDLEALIRIMNGGQKPEAAGTPPYLPTPPRLPPIAQRPHDGGIAHPMPTLPDRFPGHTISESGAKEHDDWVKLLVKDSDPGQTARMLKGAITEYGDQGRGDVADILGRLHQVDPAKAAILRRAVRDATGEDLPFRIAPRGEGFRELTDEEKLAHAPKSPFGSAQGADRWAARNMAEALLGQGDYADAVKHFRTDKSATMPYLAAVHGIMADKSPMQAMKFAKQMNEAGLTEAPEKKAGATLEPTPTPARAPTPAPASQPEPAPLQQPVPLAPPVTQPTESKPAPVPPESSSTTPPDQPARPSAKEAGKPSVPSPTNKPIDPQVLYEQLGYQHDGSGDYGNAIKHPLDAIKANKAADAATAASQSEYGKTNPALANGEGAAFRHALWSYKMAKEIGAGAARGFGDAHERDGQPDGERLMDLYNNAIGRELASDPRNKDRSDEEVIREAIKAGKLQTRPFNIPEPTGGMNRPGFAGGRLV